MKKTLLLSLMALALVGCVNVYQKPAALGNRSVITMQSTEGDNAYVHRQDSTDSVAADKVNENTSDTAISGTGNVTNTPAEKSNATKKASGSDENKDESKSVEKPIQNVEDTQTAPEN